MRVRDKVRERRYMSLSESNGPKRMKENLFEREDVESKVVKVCMRGRKRV